jgi:hypothetical protein
MAPGSAGGTAPALAIFDSADANASVCSGGSLSSVFFGPSWNSRFKEHLMGNKRKGKKTQRRPVLLQRSQPSPVPAQAHQEHKAIWTKVPRWVWATLTGIAVFVGLFAMYPSLSINEDVSFDAMFPYNSAFSITDEGYWPIADLSAICSADFTMRPWTSDPNDKTSMALHTKDDEYKDFAQKLTYKHRVTLPCNHNVVANGHRIDPGAKLEIVVSYRFMGTRFRRNQMFNFHTVMGWNGQSFWEYD